MGDSNGPENDRINSQKILNAISVYNEIHGICFVLKSSETRLNISFQYCMSELLLQLHRSALQNIVFFLTYARATFYKPGQTMEPLEAFIDRLKEKQDLVIPLNNSTLYCIDNESFRFLFAHKAGIEFTEDDYKSFGDSWKRSVKETQRFFDYLTEIKGHNVEMTISLNQARSIILKMTKPLAKISEQIQTNIKISNDRQKEIQNCDDDIIKLLDKQMVPSFGYEVTTLPYPKTVCTSQKCSSIERIPNSDQTTVVYNKICHNKCKLKNVELLQHPQPGLQKCSAMKRLLVFSSEVCKVCGCNWQEHLHINFDQKKVVVQVEDPVVKKAIENKKDAKVVKQTMLDECKKRIDQYSFEQTKITGIQKHRWGSGMLVFEFLHVLGVWTLLCWKGRDPATKKVRQNNHF